jgi:Tol biopolymer transport system component/predicted Ser/Thr protein kinase
VPTDDHLLDHVADAILDGTSIDWVAVESRAAGHRPLLQRLKVLAALAEVHRDLPAATVAFDEAGSERPGASGERVPRSATWGHLTLLEPLGRGAFGHVFRARDTRLDRDVALKLVPAASMSGDARASSIVEEGRLLAQVRHPNVVTVYGAERIGDQVGLWMELVEGRTLEQLLQEGRRFTAAEAVEIGCQVCGAVAAVHAAGLLHRDIKAHNVMLSNNGRVVLMDFGTGWEVSDSSRAAPAGTPLYLAPELLDDAEPTIRSDIYAIGVLLFHLMTGTYPVSALVMHELKRAHASHDRVDLRTLRADAPRIFASVVERAIATSPEHRQGSAAEMAAELRESRRRLPAFVLGTLSLLALAVAVIATLPALRTAVVSSPAAHVNEGVAGAIVPVTSTPGEKRYPALSPDGTQVAYVWYRDGVTELHVTDLDTGRTRHVRGPDLDGIYPRWSPDARSLAFYRRFPTDAGPQAAVRITPLDGGRARTIWQTSAGLLGNGLSWSPDGKQLALSVRPSIGEPFRLMSLDVSVGKMQWLTTPERSDAGDSRPAFSPDGASLAFVRSSGSESALHVLHLATDELVRLPAGMHDFRDMTWSDEGRSLVFTSYQGKGRDTVWRIPIAGGEAQRVAGIGEGASFPSSVGVSGRLVYLQQVFDSNLYRVELTGGAEPAPRRVAPSTRADTAPDISPDGSRIVFVSNRSGAPELWLADPDGGSEKQLTDLRARCSWPRWSPDGLRIAFALQSAAFVSSIYVADVSTGGSRRITSGPTLDYWPTWSADGQSIYFASTRSGGWQTWQVSAQVGPPLQVTQDGGIRAWESSDGASLYYTKSSSNGERAIWRRPSRGGEATLVFRLPDNTTWGGEWMPRPDGIHWLNLQSTPRLAIEFFSFASGRSDRVIVPVGPYDHGSGFSVSKDGRWAVFSQLDYHGADVMLIDERR